MKFHSRMHRIVFIVCICSGIILITQSGFLRQKVQASFRLDTFQHTEKDISTTASNTIFRDDFDGNEINQDVWQVNLNGGAIDVNSGNITLTSSSQLFPYVHSKYNIVPLAGNFSIKTGIRFPSINMHGVGLSVDDLLPPNNVLGSWSWQPTIFTIWQDSTRNIFVLNYSNQTIYSTLSPDINYHEYEYRWLDSSNEYYVDGQLVYTESRTSDVPRPIDIWFGNPVIPDKTDDWTSLQIDFIEVSILDQTNLYSVSGIVKDTSDVPIENVVITVGSNSATSYGATTSVDGTFELLLPTGNFMLRPYKAGFDFSPNEISLNTTIDSLVHKNFVGVNWGGRPTPFLYLPFTQDHSPFGFLIAMNNYNVGGRITSWFDHKYPNYIDNDGSGIWLYNTIYDDEDTKEEHVSTDGSKIYSYAGFYYDGHDGYDFSYTDPDPDDGKPNTDLLIYPAASGIVIDACNNCTIGFGNFVLLYHEVDIGNGYFTRYGHLASVDQTVMSKVNLHETVNRSDKLGIMGSTGNSSGIHLHFGVYRDNGDKVWNASDDKKVDPFEYRLQVADPWVEDYLGPSSYNLWVNNPTTQETFPGDLGTTISDLSNTISVTIPPNYFFGESVVELSPEPAPSPQFSLRGLGLSFWLRILQGMSSDPSSTYNSDEFLEQIDVDLISLSAQYNDNQIRHLNESKLALYQWNTLTNTWDQLLSIVNLEQNIISATSPTAGTFDLQAPLICPDDTEEINDAYNVAHEFVVNNGESTQLFDIPDDEDWFRFEAIEGQEYVISTSNLAPGVDTILSIYNSDGVTLLETNDNFDIGTASKLTWSAPSNGIYFVKVSMAIGSEFGCESSYEINISSDSLNIFLPMIAK